MSAGHHARGSRPRVVDHICGSCPPQGGCLQCARRRAGDERQLPGPARRDRGARGRRRRRRRRRVPRPRRRRAPPGPDGLTRRVVPRPPAEHDTRAAFRRRRGAGGGRAAPKRRLRGARVGRRRLGAGPDAPARPDHLRPRRGTPRRAQDGAGLVPGRRPDQRFSGTVASTPRGRRVDAAGSSRRRRGAAAGFRRGPTLGFGAGPGTAGRARIERTSPRR